MYVCKEIYIAPGNVSGKCWCYDTKFILQEKNLLKMTLKIKEKAENREFSSKVRVKQ